MSESGVKQGGTKYLMKLAIDFGSTNTVMAWRVYETGEDGTQIVSQKYNAINAVRKIPSTMVFAADNPGNGAVPNDLYGEAAAQAIRQSNTPPMVHDNFKQLLYTAEPGSKAYQRGIELCTTFFAYLRSEYRQIYNMFPNDVIQSMDVILYLSTPVRAHPTHRSLMKQIARDAGFTKQNGITQISTEYDEARCVVRYAMAQRKKDMAELLAKAGSPGGIMLLFVDVGGSTMDVSLENFCISPDGTQKMDPIASWPTPDVSYPLGGCLVDEAIRDYFIQNGYADKAYAMEKWENGDGKFRFRVFKEENNGNLENSRIEKLGGVASVCYDTEEDIYPAVFYSKAQNKIDKTIFEEKICDTYIRSMKEAVKSLFLNQRRIPGTPPVKPEDVDAIFLAGDGSRLYFIPRILLEPLDERSPGFVRVRKRPEYMFANWENPSLCCALGALVDQDNVITPSYARDAYEITIGLFIHHGNMVQKLQEDPYILDWKKEIYTFENITVPCRCIAYREYVLAKKYQILPIREDFSEHIEYKDDAQGCITFQMRIRRARADGSREWIGSPITITQSRKLGQSLQELARMLVVYTPGVFVEAITDGVDWVLRKLKKDSKYTEKVDKVLENIACPTKDASLDLNLMLQMSDQNQISAEVGITSKFFETGNNHFSLDV